MTERLLDNANHEAALVVLAARNGARGRPPDEYTEAEYVAALEETRASVTDAGSVTQALAEGEAASVEAILEAAIDEGRILAAHGDYYRTLFAADPVKARRVLGSLPPNPIRESFSTELGGGRVERPDDESLLMHIEAERRLAMAGKETYSGDEYFQVLATIQAERDQAAAVAAEEDAA